jgi:hypothetical protein
VIPSAELSVAGALTHGRLAEFIAQEEAGGVGPVPKADFETALARLMKAEKSEDRTSRSSSPGGSTGKKTR